MNRELVGEPGVSAFLRSVTRNLGSTSRMKPTNTAPIFYDFRQDLKTLNEKLASFQDLLVDGEARRLGETSVDGWMDDLKDLLYDVEDILDDIKWPSNDQVCFVELKATWDEIERRLIKILDKTDVFVLRAKDLELKRGCGHAFSGKFNAIRSTPETSSTVDMSEIHGRDEDKRAIVERLMASEEKGRKNYAVLSVVGMGGLGKTTLAQLVFNDPEVEIHFDLKSWVCISDDFDVTRATKDLVQYWGGGVSSFDKQSQASLQKRLEEMVRNKRFLFVLDDMWSSSEWEKMKAPFSSCAKGSKILVTTRNIKIAQDLGDRNPYKLQGLNREQCMAIFRDKAFGDGVIVEEWEQEKLMILGHKIVEGCKGVPLAVKVIGSVLQGAEEEKWRAVSENADLWDTTHMKDEIHPAIRLSYHYLPASLKRCFEFLAAFPTDSEFNRDYVVRLWIAEGLIEEVDGRMVEDIGNQYYNELKARSLIQENDMMHDIVHHLASLLSRKFCYKQNSKEHYASMRHTFDFNPIGQLLTEAPSLRTLRVSTTRDPILQNDILPAIQSCKMLRTLDIRKNFSFNPDLDSSISSQVNTFRGNLTHLRYLTIVNSRAQHLPDFICKMENLQFLDLLWCKALQTLPQEMNHLSKLQYLRFYNSSLSILPESICALLQLRVLDLGECYQLIQLPKDIGDMRSLRTLVLKNARIESLPESICALPQLQVLDLGSCYQLRQLPKGIGDIRSLRTLVLKHTPINSLPESICALSQLQLLDLDRCDRLKQLPKDMSNIRSLRTLVLACTHITSLPESICALSQLQVLDLSGCGSLKQLPKDMTGNLRSLHTLDLSFTELEELPLHIGRLTRLDALPVYHVHKEEGLHLSELNLMNSLSGRLIIGSMENIESVEEASMADLKSKTNIQELHFLWSRPGNDGEMTVKILEVLKPHHTLESMTIKNYSGDKFPDWIMSSNICLSNLTDLALEGLNKICEMVGMEFVSLDRLRIENCPRLRKVLMATPKLSTLVLINLRGLEAASVHFLPNLSNKDVGLHMVVSQLKTLSCTYNIFEYFFEELQTIDWKWSKLYDVTLQVGRARLASLPRGWPIMMNSIVYIKLDGIGPGKFQLLPEGDESIFPPSIRLTINDKRFPDHKLPHHWFTINSDGKIES